MKTIDDTNKKLEVYSLLIVVLSGIIGAILLTFIMTWYYTTEGAYRATNVLIEPSLLSKVKYVDQEEGKGDKSSYVFDKVTYISDGTTMNLSQQQYEQIYKLVEKDISTQADAEQEFARKPIATLAVVLKNPKHQSLYTLVTMDVAYNGDYYRVQLRESSGANMWAYFSHPNISKQIEDIIKYEQHSR